MNTRETRPRITVCLCWFHPLVPSEFRRLLSGNGLRLSERRVDPKTLGEGARLRLTRANVYILEAHSDLALTESLVTRLLEQHPGARILMVAERFDQRSAFSLLRLGVKGLLGFDQAPSSLRRAVKEISREGFWVQRSLLSRFIDSTVRSLQPWNPKLLTDQTHLSRRENEVCGLLLENLSNREIASRLHVSERTAKFHVSNLLAKCGLRRRADLVVLSYTRLQNGDDPRRGPRASRFTEA
jgi:DNA-binding NarL/FixJ family response regulator